MEAQEVYRIMKASWDIKHPASPSSTDLSEGMRAEG